VGVTSLQLYCAAPKSGHPSPGFDASYDVTSFILQTRFVSTRINNMILHVDV